MILHGREYPRIVLALGPNSYVGSGSGFIRNRTVATGLTTPKTRTIGNGPVLSIKTQRFKFTILAPIKYLSSDHIMIWSVHILWSFSRFFTSRCQIPDSTSIHWDTIENPQISHLAWCNFTAIQRIQIRSLIWKQEVEEWLKQHDQRIDHVMICWDLRHLVGGNCRNCRE